MQTLTRRGVGDAAAGLSLHVLHMSEGPFRMTLVISSEYDTNIASDLREKAFQTVL